VDFEDVICKNGASARGERRRRGRRAGRRDMGAGAEEDTGDEGAEGSPPERPRLPYDRLMLGGAVAAVALGLVFTGWVAWREYAAQRLERMSFSLIAGFATGEKPADLDRWVALCGAQCPARGIEAAAAAKAALAGKAAGPARAALYADAEMLTRRGLARSPLSAEGWARLALILSAQAGDRATPAVLEALRTSYAAGAFSRGAAVWRIGFCGAHWTGLDAGLRQRASEELVWLAQVDPSLADAVAAQVHDPAARFALQLALSLRRADRP
jgi:hypothetical protein